MFGNDSLPSRVYSYGGKPPCENVKLGRNRPCGCGLPANSGKAPCSSFQLIEKQMSLAHQFKNSLVETERVRREKVEKLLAELSPELVTMDQKIAEIKALQVDAEDGIKKASALARKNVRPPDLVAIVKKAKKDIVPFWKKRKILRKKLFASRRWKKESVEIEACAKEEIKQKRGACGLYFGSYLHVEQSLGGIRSGAPPNFHPWNGDGHIAVQLQPKGGNGVGKKRHKGTSLTVAEAFACTDTRLRIEPVPPEAWLPGGRKLRKSTVWFRIGTDKSRGPIWGKIQIVLHRPLPEDAVIKWAHILRYRIATNYEWHVQFVLSRASGWAKPDSAKDGVVGINVGWRIKPDGSLRAAYWVGSDGEEGEILLPAAHALESGREKPSWLEQMKKTRDIQSIRDENLNKMKAVFVEDLKRAPQKDMPEWLKESMKWFHVSRSPGRFAALAIKWRSLRFPGDLNAFICIDEWQKRDRHLFQYQGNLRDQLQNQRLDIYRKIANMLRLKYHVGVLAVMKLPKFHRKSKIEESPQDKALREHNRDAAVSYLNTAIKQAMVKVKDGEAKNITKTCSNCESVQEVDGKKIEHTCSGCGVTYDIDRNAAMNLLKQAGASILVKKA